MRIVLAEVIATAALSVILLTFFYPVIRKGIFKFQHQILKSKPRLAAFTAALFLVPIVIVALSNVLA